MTFRAEVVCLHEGGEQQCSVVEIEMAELALETGNPIGELRETGLGDDDGARFAKIFCQGRFVGRDEPIDGESAAGGRHVGGLYVVLERDGDAVEGTSNPALRALAIPFGGFLERIAIHSEGGMQLILIDGNAREVLRDEFPRSDLTLLHGGAHVGNRSIRAGPSPIRGETNACDTFHTRSGT
jgi:hypothetical protein